MIVYYKDPDAVKDYGWDWGTNFLGSDTIAASNWFADDVAITITTDSFDNTTTTVWLSGGTLGATYLITNRITTAGGRTDDRSFHVKITEQ